MSADLSVDAHIDSCCLLIYSSHATVTAV